jgi:hypothetical protein
MYLSVASFHLVQEINAVNTRAAIATKIDRAFVADAAIVIDAVSRCPTPKTHGRGRDADEQVPGSQR